MNRICAFILSVLIIITTFVSCNDLTACEHSDNLLDHICDLCGEGIGVHADKANDGNHKCDYCNALMSLCEDKNNDGLCDECNEKMNSDDSKDNTNQDNNQDDNQGDNQDNTDNDSDIDNDLDLPDSFDISTPITITFYHTMGQTLRSVLDKYIVEFNKIYPNINVKHKQVGGYDDVRDQIKTEIAVGAQPNIAYCYPDHVAIYNSFGATVSLDNLISSNMKINLANGITDTLGLTQEQINDFIPGFYNEGKQFGDGKIYTLPLSKSSEVLYYNKTFFDEHGLSVPTTWDELEAVCKRIKEIDPDSIPLGYDSESNWFITMCEQMNSPYTNATVDHFLFDNETNRNFVKKFRDWYQKGYVTTQEISGGYTSSLFTRNESEPGKSYMSIGSSAGATHQRPTKENGGYPFEVGITTVPQIDASKPKVISQGPSLCIFNKSNTQEVLASWLFVKFLTTNVDFQAEFSMNSGYMPVIKSVNSHHDYNEKFLAKADGGDNIQALVAKVCLNQSNAYLNVPAFNGSAEARDEVGLLMQKCFTTKDVLLEDTIKAYFKAAIAALSRYNVNNIVSGKNEATLDNAKYALSLIMSYKNGEATSNDYDIVRNLTIGETVFEVTWKTDNENIKIEESSNKNFWIVDLPDINKTEMAYNLIATIKAADGSTVDVTFTLILSVFDNAGVARVFEEGVAYVMFMKQINLGYNVYALNTTENGENKYIETTLHPKDAAVFYVEIVDGGYKLYTEINGVKNYLHAELKKSDGGKVYKYIYFKADSNCVFTYDKELTVFKITSDGVEYGVGTYNYYETISLSDATYFRKNNINVAGGQFPIGLMTKAHADTLPPSEAPANNDPKPDSTLFIADAIALGNSKINTHYTEGKYYVEGTVKEIKNTTFGNLVITDGTNDLLIYGTWSEDGKTRFDKLEIKPAVGDKIKVYGIIGNYNYVPQMKNGWIIGANAGEDC